MPRKSARVAGGVRHKEPPVEHDGAEDKAKPTRRTRSARVPPRARSRVGLWLLRLLVRGGLARSYWDGDDWPGNSTAKALGIRRRRGSATSDEDDIETIEVMLAKWLRGLERSSPPEDSRERNVRWLADKLRLRPVDRDVLLFAAVIQDDEALRAAVMDTAPQPLARCATIAVALEHPVRAVQAATRASGRLMQMGLLLPRRDGPYRFSMPFSLMPGLDDILAAESSSVDALLASFFTKACKAKHALHEFPHLAAEAALAERILRAAAAKRMCGVNVLLYGPPGTGKTELARSLAAAASADMYEVVVTAPDAQVKSGHQRLAAYSLCQRLLGGVRRTVVLFDEAEDAFPRVETHHGPRRETGGHKGFVNTLLENNAIPTIWISNSIDHVDAAYLRRFDLALEVGELPPDVRRKVIRDSLGRVGVRDDWVERWAADDRLRFGHVARAARVTGMVGANTAEEAERISTQVIHATLRVERAPARRAAVRLDVCAYDPAFVNANIDLDQLVQGLSRTGRGALCVFGPPGSGKSAFVAHLAQRLGRGLHAMRGSDLLSKWVGGTEARIARAFACARQGDAILLIDEADSFLQDRSRALRTWEITGVNELLMQMESFDGVFVCATNLFESLDAAALRRFDFKIRFGPIQREQRWRLLMATLAARGIELGGDDRARSSLDRLHGVTPGDFAAVARRMDVLGTELTAERFVDELAEEERAKLFGGGARIGFRFR